MNFTAPAFVLLFPIVLALHWMLPPSRRWVLLLAASLGFYAVGLSLIHILDCHRVQPVLRGRLPHLQHRQLHHDPRFHP